MEIFRYSELHFYNTPQSRSDSSTVIPDPS
jgi:hypothetical protein